MAKRKKRKKGQSSFFARFMATILIVGVLALIIYGLAHSKWDASPRKEKTIVVSPSILHKMYDQNEASAIEQLNDSLIEIFASVTSINASDPKMITVQDNSEANPNSSAQLTFNSGQQNEAMLLNKGDQIAASCTNTKDEGGIPYLTGCSFIKIVTPVYGQGTNAQLSLSKIYSNYDGKSFETQFLMGVPQTMLFDAKVECQTKNIMLTNVFFLNKDQDGKEVLTNLASLTPKNAAQKKAVDADYQLKDMLQPLLNSKTNANEGIAAYIDRVCSFAAS